MSTQAEQRVRARRDRLQAFGFSHPDDDFYSRTPDLTGVGILTKADVREGRLQVEVEAHGVVFYLDTTNPRCADELFNLPRLPLGTRVAVSAGVRSIGPRGVRLGRLALLPCEAPFERMVFRPQLRANGQIRLAETVIPDPGPACAAFHFVSAQGAVMTLPLPEV